MESPAEEKSDSGMMMNAVDQFPFMGHVLVVLVITYLFLSFTSNGFFYFCFLIVYLFEVERRGRERERRRIASEERRKINTRRTFDEGETLRWLNEGIKSMWPVCMEKFASKHLFGPMVPEFLNIYKPWGVNEVKIDSLQLGSTPPVFNFVRALERPAEGDHVVYESTMDFCSGDDMNAKMTVQTVRRFGGFWTTFYISRLHVEGTVRISVKFLKGWPVLGRVRLCFASKPKVTMSYRPIDRNGIDVSLIPVFANIVEKMVDNAMEHAIVQPNIFVVDIEKLVSTMFSDSKAQQGATGIFKVENKSTLVVEILEATNLKAADSNGLSDPFVEITFGQQQKKTKVKRKTLNPKWENEQHEFPIINWDMSNLLTLRVRDWDRVPTIGSSHELGICTVPVNEYRNGERRELDLPLEKVSKGRLRFAITVNYTHRPQVAQEPPPNNSGRETLSQEIKTSSSAVNYASPHRASEITRSKSETNLERLRTPLSFEGSKYNSQNSTGEPAFLDAVHGQTPIGESHDVIHMPYGPPGAFTIFHPGLVSPLRFPLSKETDPLVTKSSELDKGGGAEIKQRRLRYFQRRKRRNSRGTNSQENIQVDTMSDGDSSSVDFSAELKNFIPEPYHGPVKMTLDCPGTTNFPPAEPPSMDLLGPFGINSKTHLEPILGGKTPTTPAINMFFGNAEGNINGLGSAAAAEEEVDTRGSLLSGRPKVEGSSAATNLNVEGLKTNRLAGLPTSSGSHPQRRPRNSPKRQSAKPMFSLPTTWYKKMTLLAKRAKRKKRHEKSEIVYSSELKYPSGHYAEGDRPVSFYHEDSDTSIPSGPQASFLFESPLDTKRVTNVGGTPGTAPFGDSPEQRKIINSRSRASGSQSDRHWASKVKKLIPDQFRTSQSFRHESLDLRRLQTPILDSSLQSIPERSGQHRNGKVRG